MNTTISENKCYEGNKTGWSERFGYSGLEKGWFRGITKDLLQMVTESALLTWMITWGDLYEDLEVVFHSKEIAGTK